MSEYTPSTEEMREDYWSLSGTPRRDSTAWGEFDRWLVSVKASLLRSLAEKYDRLAVSAEDEDMPMTVQDIAVLLSEEASFIERGEE